MERNEKLESIVRLTQKELKQQVKLELEEMGYKPISKKGFLYAEGEHTVLLVAHLDTVHKTPVQSICYSTDGRVMMSPEGIGGDDRCGVYMILEIIKSARCHVLFCEDEEIGCQGARAFANSKIRPQVNYIVEMDRRGSNDAVFYRCANPDFTDFVCGFGFDHALGSFSDICAVAPRLGVAAVNISAGYHNEHSRHKQIDLPAMQNNIRRITEMVQTPSEPFDYVEQTYFYGSQMTMENISLWDIVSSPQQQSRSKWLMPLPDKAYILLGDFQVEDAEMYMIDSSGGVYCYIPELDAAVYSENLQAYNADGEEVVFERRSARYLRTYPLDVALSLLE